MKPIGKNIIIKTIDEDVVTDSGLILSGEDTNQLRYRKGLVIQPGIYYDKAHGYTMIIRDVQYTIIQERDVVVVLT